MARQPEYRQAYELIETWKNNCLLDKRGIIWQEENLWIDEVFARFRYVFIDSSDVSSGSFYEELADQLKGEHEKVYKYIIELLLYYIVSTRTTYETKVSKIEMIAS